MTGEEHEVPLMEAAHRLGISYSKALRLTLTGALAGSQKDGRWQVSSKSVDGLIASRSDQQPPAKTPSA